MAPMNVMIVLITSNAFRLVLVPLLLSIDDPGVNLETPHPFFRIDDPLAMNGLAAGLLLFQYVVFSFIYRTRDVEKHRFFLYGCFAWGANMLYVWLLDINKNSPHFLPDTANTALTFTLNTITMLFFLLASQKQLKLSFPRMPRVSTICVASAVALVIPLVDLIYDQHTSIVAVAIVVCYSAVSLFLFGLAYHLFFRNHPHTHGAMMRAGIIYPIYAYALLQGGFFFNDVPIVSSIVVLTLHGVFHLAGMSFKLLHLMGLVAFSQYLFRDYEEKRKDLKAKQHLLSDAQDAVRAVRQLTHEIKTPHAALAFLSTLVAESSTDKEKLLQHAKRLTELTGRTIEVIDVFRESIPTLESGPLPDESKRLNVNTLCNISIRTLQAAMVLRTNVRREYSQDTWVWGKEAEIIQVVRNLLKNAVEATEQKDPPQVYVRTDVIIDDSGTRSVKLVVCDNGDGISDDNRTRVFDDGFTTKPGSPRGYGLGISRRLAEKHRGKVELVHNRGGRLGGATFVLTLPYAPKQGEYKGEH